MEHDDDEEEEAALLAEMLEEEERHLAMMEERELFLQREKERRESMDRHILSRSMQFKHYFYATPSGASAVVILQRAWRRFSRMRAMVAWSNPESDRHRHVVEEHEHCLRAANVVRDYIARHDYSFAELDRDGSGFIERSEFDALLKECHVESADALWRRFSRANDLDGFVKFIKDGNVDIAEAKLRAVLHAADSDLYDVFAVFDEDGDGSVSRDDFAQALHELGFDRNLHQHEVEDLAARLIDDGGDDKGRIDYDAFLERFGNFRDFQKGPMDLCRYCRVP